MNLPPLRTLVRWVNKSFSNRAAWNLETAMFTDVRTGIVVGYLSDMEVRVFVLTGLNEDSVDHVSAYDLEIVADDNVNRLIMGWSAFDPPEGVTP